MSDMNLVGGTGPISVGTLLHRFRWPGWGTETNSRKPGLQGGAIIGYRDPEVHLYEVESAKRGLGASPPRMKESRGRIHPRRLPRLGARP